jgi:mono/diheme cytochrome c family protein
MLKKFFVLAGIACLVMACEKDPKQPGYEIKILSDMVEPVPYEAFGENRIFADGKNMQAPVQGTIPRGATPFEYEATDADAERAGREVHNPLKPDSKNIERGKFVYETFCLSCHGVTGDGDGQLIPKYPNPPSVMDKKLLKMPDGRMFHSITKGKKDMPSHASQLSVEDRWKVILYLRELQKQEK